MFENDETTVDAVQEEVADSPIDENEELDDEAEGEESAEADEDAPEGEEAESVKPQPPKDKKPPQSKEDNSKYAAARKEAEAEARRVKAEVEAAKQRQDAFAKRYGYESFDAMEQAEKAKEYVAEGMTDKAAQKLVELEARLARAESESEQAERDRQEQRKYGALYDAYPETRKMDALPPEVMDMMAAGETPLHAYRAYKIQKLEAENTALKQNTTTKAKAIGGLKGPSQKVSKPDPFLAGLGL